MTTQSTVHLVPSQDKTNKCLENLKTCLEETKSWMNNNRLKMNCSKTEFILFGNKIQLGKCTTKDIPVSSELVPATDTINYLGVLWNPTSPSNHSY